MANGVGVKSRLQALQIAYVLASLPTAAVAAFVAAVSKGFFALGASRQSHAIFLDDPDACGALGLGCQVERVQRDRRTIVECDRHIDRGRTVNII